MGRTARLVDPQDGPLQSFAHDLRGLREEAGNPTYRALAKTAGFSPSTLGEAAGGVRRPSLDVTLAFVGACGGDVEAWQARWYALDRELTAQARDAADDLDQPTVTAGAAGNVRLPETQVNQASDVDGAAEVTLIGSPTDLAAGRASVGESPRRTAGFEQFPFDRRTRRVVLPAFAVVTVSALIAIGVLFGTRGSGSNATGAPPSVPAADAKSSATVSTSGSAHAAACATASAKGLFSGSTRASGARLRRGASMADTVLRTIGPNCGLEFAGYCLGDVVPDPFGGTPDMRWFEVVGGGVVASAVVHGNPPASLKPSPCQDSVPLPTAIALSADPSADDPGALDLHATGSHVWIVGFATLPATVRWSGGAVPASAQWQQIGLVGNGAAGFTIAWSARPAVATPPTGPTGTVSSGASGPGTEGAGSSSGSGTGTGTGGAASGADDHPADRVPIVAVACFGGQGPTDVLDAESVSVTDPRTKTPLKLTAAQRKAAANAACSYPRP
ncbi:MAG: helix-turn-helix domain-containing protein [Actinocrinis sp.]